jgi:hypothetical protein
MPEHTKDQLDKGANVLHGIVSTIIRSLLMSKTQSFA